MKNGHKIVLEWAKETDKTIELFKQNSELQLKLWDKIVEETTGKNEVVVYFTTRSQPLSQREVAILEVADALLEDDEIEVRNYCKDIVSDGEADSNTIASADWGTDEEYGCYDGGDW